MLRRSKNYSTDLFINISTNKIQYNYNTMLYSPLCVNVVMLQLLIIWILIMSHFTRRSFQTGLVVALFDELLVICRIWPVGGLLEGVLDGKRKDGKMLYVFASDTGRMLKSSVILFVLDVIDCGKTGFLNVDRASLIESLEDTNRFVWKIKIIPYFTREH